MSHFIKFFATGAYAGYVPLAPGTFGAAVGCALYLALRGLPDVAYFFAVVAFCFFAVWVSAHAQKMFEGADPSQIVIDEIAGILVTMLFHDPKLSMLFAGFILFRIFDIVKPWPVSWFERRYDDGRGIVLDDVMAGIYANAALWIFELVLPACGVKW